MENDVEIPSKTPIISTLIPLNLLTYRSRSCRYRVERISQLGLLKTITTTSVVVMTSTTTNWKREQKTTSIKWNIAFVSRRSLSIFSSSTFSRHQANQLADSHCKQANTPKRKTNDTLSRLETGPKSRSEIIFEENSDCPSNNVNIISHICNQSQYS